MIVRDSGHTLAHVSAADTPDTWGVARSGADAEILHGAADRQRVPAHQRAAGVVRWTLLSAASASASNHLRGLLDACIEVPVHIGGGISQHEPPGVQQRVLTPPIATERQGITVEFTTVDLDDRSRPFIDEVTDVGSNHGYR